MYSTEYACSSHGETSFSLYAPQKKDCMHADLGSAPSMRFPTEIPNWKHSFSIRPLYASVIVRHVCLHIMNVCICMYPWILPGFIALFMLPYKGIRAETLLYRWNEHAGQKVGDPAALNCFNQLELHLNKTSIFRCTDRFKYKSRNYSIPGRRGLESGLNSWCVPPGSVTGKSGHGWIGLAFCRPNKFLPRNKGSTTSLWSWQVQTSQALPKWFSNIGNY